MRCFKRITDALGFAISPDNRGNRYVTLEGEDNTKTVMVALHNTVRLIDAYMLDA